MAFVLMMTGDDSFSDQWCEGVFDTREDAHNRMAMLYASRLADADDNECGLIDEWSARVENTFGSGNQWKIIKA